MIEIKKTKEIFPNPLSFTSILITMYFDETRLKLCSLTGFISKKMKNYI